jgi:hypothetical protein
MREWTIVNYQIEHHPQHDPWIGLVWPASGITVSTNLCEELEVKTEDCRKYNIIWGHIIEWWMARCRSRWQVAHNLNLLFTLRFLGSKKRKWCDGEVSMTAQKGEMTQQQAIHSYCTWTSSQSLGMSPATWRAKTTEPTRGNLFACTVTIIPGHTTDVVYNRREITKKIVGNIPEKFVNALLNQNNSCYVVGHWYSKVRTPCFPKQKGKYRICVKSSSIHVYNFHFQFGRRKVR